MKKGYYFGFGCLTSILMIVGFWVMIFVGVKAISKSDFVKIKENSLLVVELKGPVKEYSRLKNDKFFIEETTVVDVVDAIKKATEDSRIEGLLLKPEMLSCGYASLNEIIEAIELFKKRGKAVTAFVSIASNSDMLIASTAQKIVISGTSSAGVMLKGFGVNRAYYKDMFDRFGIKMNVISAGKYKDYGTQYSHNSMSEESKTNIERILKARYELFVNQISQQLDLSALAIEEVMNDEDFFILNNIESSRVGLIDVVQYEEDFLKEQEKYYNNVIDSRDYLLGFKARSNTNLENKIAVLYLNGSIMPLESDFTKLSSGWVEDAVDAILKDKTVKGCVLRVNSPGGSALESEKILQTLKRLKERMPVIVSMSDVAASGGYMISMAGDEIFADPYTITGSIGVVQLVPELKELQKRLGINHEVVEYGKKSGWLNPLNGMSDNQKNAFKSSADNVYLSFKKIVKEGRGETFVTLDDVEKVAQGQVWDSISAKENGLIDQIGSLTKAVMHTATLAKLTSFERKNFPEREDIFMLFAKEKMGIQQLKTMILRGTSETIYEQKTFYDAVKKNSIQTLLPISFDK